MRTLYFLLNFAVSLELALFLKKKMYTVQKWMDSIADTSIESNIQTKKFPFVTHGYTVCISFIKDM